MPRARYTSPPRHRPARNASKSGRRWWNVTPRPASASSAPREYFDARREERTAAAERAGQRQAALAEECGRLRQQLSQLERGGRFYRQDAGGGPVYLSDAELDAIRRELASRESERCR